VRGMVGWVVVFGCVLLGVVLGVGGGFGRGFMSVFALEVRLVLLQLVFRVSGFSQITIGLVVIIYTTSTLPLPPILLRQIILLNNFLHQQQTIIQLLCDIKVHQQLFI
jgi:hypothetical protein